MNLSVVKKQRGAPKSRKSHRRADDGSSPRDESGFSPAERPDFSLLSGYQEQIGTLEQAVTKLHDRVASLTTAVTEARDSEAQFREFFENTPTAYLVHDDKGLISAHNGAAARLLGFKRARRLLSDTSVMQLVLREDLPLWFEHMRRCGETLHCTTAELRLLSKERRILPVQLLTLPGLVPFRGGKPERFYTLFLDVTGRRQAEAALAKTQRGYHNLIDAIEGIVWEADVATLNVSFVSRYAERLLGYRLSEWTRRGFWEDHIYVDDREQVVNQVSRAAAQGENLSIEYRVLTSSREVRWLHDTITVVNRDARPRLLGVAIDVTQRRQAEEQLRKAHRELERRVAERTAELREKVGELEAFSYSISHDLRSPLRAMIGFATLALEDAAADASPQLKEYLGRIMGSAARADRLIQDVLTYSRMARASMAIAPVDLEKLLRDLIAQSVDLQPPRAQIEVERPLRRVLGHEACLSQCILNLLNNATKFVSPGVTPRIRVRTEMVDGRVRIWFEDNGIGIEPANLSRIFNIFERVHPSGQYEGTGIGLAIVRKGVERLGGTVGVESQPGHGSRFWVQLNDGGRE